MKNQTLARQRREFFFAEASAGMYDSTIGMVVPHYDSMHDFVLYLLRKHQLRPRRSVLDIGSGTGTDSVAILTAFPDVHVTSIDLCAPIQDVHRKKIQELDTHTLRLSQRSTLICSDILGYSSGEKLLEEASRGVHFSAIVTTLTIHHLEHAEKQRFYRMMYQALSPGGCLINADLFSYANPRMYRNAFDFDLDWMKKEFTAPVNPYVKAIPKARRSQLLKKWIQHYKTSNRLEPLEDGATRVGQLSMIRKAGFHKVVVPYRLSLSGIVMALK